MVSFRVEQTAAGMRADLFLTSKFPKFTRSSLENLFKRSFVTIGGKAIKASHRLKFGDYVTVDDSLLKKAAPAINLRIIYEDDDVLVVNKPAGLLTHAKGALNEEATVASSIKPKINKTLEGNRAGIAHRLDRATSGVIITAKNKMALEWLQKQFSTRKTIKTYLAVVEGKPKEDVAEINAPIARNPLKPQTFKVSVLGKSAITNYKVVKNFDKKGKSYSLIKLRPKTGRTHQLRVHTKYIGHPIVGDNIYGKDGEQMLLHAESLELILPSKQKMLFRAPLPNYFEVFING